MRVHRDELFAPADTFRLPLVRRTARSAPREPTLQAKVLRRPRAAQSVPLATSQLRVPFAARVAPRARTPRPREGPVAACAQQVLLVAQLED